MKIRIFALLSLGFAVLFGNTVSASAQQPRCPRGSTLVSAPEFGGRPMCRHADVAPSYYGGYNQGYRRHYRSQQRYVVNGYVDQEALIAKTVAATLAAVSAQRMVQQVVVQPTGVPAQGIRPTSGGRNCSFTRNGNVVNFMTLPNPANRVPTSLEDCNSLLAQYGGK